MDNKKVDILSKNQLYIWRLASFLAEHNTIMSGEELAEHFNRNSFKTTYGTKYSGKRGIYTLIRQTWKLLNKDLNLPKEAEKVAKSYVKPDGTYAYE